MKYISIFLLSLLATPFLSASPSETAHFLITFTGEDAEKFKNKSVHTSNFKFGPNGEHIGYDSALSFITNEDDEEKKFVLSLSCQQRVLNYQTQTPSKLAPTCEFVYFNHVMHTTIVIPQKISERLIQEFSWKSHANARAGQVYFGCFDNMEAGCPNIRYYPATETRESELEISFYKP